MKKDEKFLKRLKNCIVTPVICNSKGGAIGYEREINCF